MQNRVFIVTGANGHLGSALVRLLKSRKEEVRGLVLAGEKVHDGPLVRYFAGDVTRKESLRPLFENLGDREAYVIHTAGIVDISGEVTKALWQVNVEGTKNVLELCREYGVKRLVYVSWPQGRAWTRWWSILPGSWGLTTARRTISYSWCGTICGEGFRPA